MSNEEDTIKRITSLEVTYDDGTGEIFHAPPDATGPLTVNHTLYPPSKKGDKASAISFVTATLPIPTPPAISRQMGVTPVDPEQD